MSKRFRSTQRAIRRGHLKLEFDSATKTTLVKRKVGNDNSKWVLY